MIGRLKMAVVGAGMMATKRTEAFLATGRVDLVGVASGSKANAEAFAQARACPFATDDFRGLNLPQPDFVLIEVPHDVQSEVLSWALQAGLHSLVGSALATDREDLARIRTAVHRRRTVVEGGFEARYEAVWMKARDLVYGGTLGEVCAMQSIACWSADPDSWYYSQRRSGGMPLTHMTYAFLNPLMWIFGPPRRICASANTIGPRRDGMVREVTCSALLDFDRDISCTVLASYVNHAGAPSWKVVIHGTRGLLEVFPAEFGPGRLVLHRNGQSPTSYDAETAAPDLRDPFVHQATAFLDALRGDDRALQNTPASAAQDLAVAEAIVTAARTRGAIDL